MVETYEVTLTGTTQPWETGGESWGDFYSSIECTDGHVYITAPNMRDLIEDVVEDFVANLSDRLYENIHYSETEFVQVESLADAAGVDFDLIEEDQVWVVPTRWTTKTRLAITDPVLAGLVQQLFDHLALSEHDTTNSEFTVAGFHRLDDSGSVDDIMNATIAQG